MSENFFWHFSPDFTVWGKVLPDGQHDPPGMMRTSGEDFHIFIHIILGVLHSCKAPKTLFESLGPNFCENIVFDKILSKMRVRGGYLGSI